MKVTLAAVFAALLGVLALAASTGEERRPAAARPPATAAPVPEAEVPPLLQTAGARRLRTASPRTLRPRGRTIRMPIAIAADGVLSPGGRWAAFISADPPDRVALADLARGRATRSLRLGGGPLGHLTWLTEDRFVVFSGIDRGGTDLVEVDARRWRVVSRRHFRAEPIATARSRDGVVALLAPPGEIGRARLLVRRPGRPDRTIRTLRLRAGFERFDPRAVVPRARNVKPGLAVDPERDVAYVVDAETDRLAEIDLERESQREGPLGRAAKVVDSRVRFAAWLGEGKLAVAGHRDRNDGTIEPHGLRIVDVEDPRRRQRVLAPRQAYLASGEGRVVAWQIGGGGIAVFDRDGRREHRLLAGTPITHVDVHGPYAYAHQPRARTLVVDLRSGRIVGRSRPRVRAAAPVAEPAPSRGILGVSYRRGPYGRIALHDPLTLRRLRGGGVVHGGLWDWDASPDGRRVALGVSNRGRIEVFDRRDPRRARRIEVGGREGVRVLRWVAGDRLLAVVGHARPQALEIDVSSRRVISRHRLGGQDYAVARTADGLAVVTGPADGEGAARLVLVRAGQPPRTIELDGVRAARYTRPDFRPDAPPGLVPGLAVDGGVAYVAPAGPQSIVRVDLASGAVTTHALRATAAKGGALRDRGLQVLGGGRLLLTGADIEPNGRVRRAFTRIVDTATWSARTLSDQVSSAVGSPAGVVLLRYEERFLTVHAPDGRRLARHRPRYGLSDVRIHGRYAYVANGARHRRNQRTHVIDLRTGRRVRVLAVSTLPRLLTRP